MVFLNGNCMGVNGLPNNGYGFWFGSGPDPEGVDCGERLDNEDLTVILPPTDKNNDGGSAEPSPLTVTHRHMFDDHPENNGVKIVEGRTYVGRTAGDEKNVIGKISAAHFDVNSMSESLQMAGDTLKQELYEAMVDLFDYNGEAKGSFKSNLTGENDLCLGILYIGGVYVRNDYRGRYGLGNEMIRALTESINTTATSEIFCDLVLLCPAADPHPGSQAAWNLAFDALSASFRKMGFRSCGSARRRSGQSMYMFLEPMEHDLTTASEKIGKVPAKNPVSVPPEIVSRKDMLIQQAHIDKDNGKRQEMTQADIHVTKIFLNGPEQPEDGKDPSAPKVKRAKTTATETPAVAAKNESADPPGWKPLF